jgi:hypothetical protein
MREWRRERWYEPRSGCERERGDAEAAEAAEAAEVHVAVGEVEIEPAAGEEGGRASRRGIGRLSGPEGLGEGMRPALWRLFAGFVGGHGGFERGEDRSGEAGVSGAGAGGGYLLACCWRVIVMVMPVRSTDGMP